MPTAPSSARDTVIGVDIGGTKTHAVAFDHHLCSLADVRVPTGTGSAESVASSTIAMLHELHRRIEADAVCAIGVGIPGLVDRATGTVRQAVNLGVGDDALELAERLSAEFGVPCHVENDVNAAALGALQVLRRDQPVSDLAYLSLGTGIAAGLILDGHLHRGRRGVAGEIGHLPVMADGPLCRCGLRGCLETVASGSAIAGLWPVAEDAASTSGLFAAAGTDDELAVDALDRVSDHLAFAVYLLAVTYDVDLIVLGGGVADAGEQLTDAIDAGLARLGSQSEFVRSLHLRERVRLKPPGPIGAIGAATLARRSEDRAT